MEFNQRLKQLREQQNLTQKELGEALNYGSSAIANYESGRNQPSIQDLIKIRQIFNVTMDYLLGVTDVPYPTCIPLTSEVLEKISSILSSEFCNQEQALEEIFKPILKNLLDGNTLLQK